ncbi:MAG TPA: transcriptional repressor [Clostridiales bacterium]|nr:transcriptional repressor [Clostridiales bacterium]
MDKGYKTKQKEKILEHIKANMDRHITAAEIVAHLNAEGTTVGATTVYRYLDKLVEIGYVRKYIMDEKSSACYQYVQENEECGEHFHLKCVKCGELFHTSCDFMQGIDVHILKHHGFRVDNTKTVLYGECESCHSKLEEK